MWRYCHAGCSADNRPDFQQPDVGFPFWPRGENLERGRIEIGATIASTNRSGSVSTSAVAASSVRFKPITEPNALSGVAIQAAPHGDREIRVRRRAARIVVLDDDGGRLVELADDRQRAVEIQQIVVRKLFAVKLVRRDEIRSAARRAGIQGPALVRVFAVAQRHLAPQHQRNRGREIAVGCRVLSPRNTARWPGRIRPCGQTPRRPAGGARRATCRRWSRFLPRSRRIARPRWRRRRSDGSWPPRGSGSARRCRSARSLRRRVTSGRATVASNGYRFTTTRSNGTIPCSAACANVVRHCRGGRGFRRGFSGAAFSPGLPSSRANRCRR